MSLQSSRSAFSRRSFIKACGLGAASLPFFKLLEDSYAKAVGETLPLRFVTIYHPHGIAAELWAMKAADTETTFDIGYTGRDEIGDVAASFRDLKVTAEPQLTTFTNAAGPFGGWDGWGWGGWGWGGWGCCGWGSGFSTTTAQTYWKGTLVVSLTDSHRKQLIFQGVSSDMISSRAGKNTKRLQKGINEIFEKYPPQ